MSPYDADTPPTDPHLLENLLPSWMAAAGVTGLSLAVVERGRPLYTSQYGYANRLTGEHVTDQTVFLAASLTKPILAWAALKLVERGLLDLERTLQSYLPDPYLPDDPYCAEITIRQVLSHTTGFPNWASSETPLRCYFPPGERFSYSGEGFVFLQKVIETVSGQSLDEFLYRQVLAPSGMQHSSLVWQPAYEKLAAVGHDALGQPQAQSPIEEPNAAYSLYSTPADYARFIQRLLDPPSSDQSQLSANLMEEMLSPQVLVNDLAPWNPDWPNALLVIDPAVSWGLGWGLQEMAERRSFWHWGDSGHFQAICLGSRELGRGFVAMANSVSAHNLWLDMARLLMGGPQPALDWLEILLSQYTDQVG